MYYRRTATGEEMKIIDSIKRKEKKNNCFGKAKKKKQVLLIWKRGKREGKSVTYEIKVHGIEHPL